MPGPGRTPFSLFIVAPEAELCSRQEELRRVTAYARDGEKVVLVSPRRYGKTTLAKKPCTKSLPGTQAR